MYFNVFLLINNTIFFIQKMHNQKERKKISQKTSPRQGGLSLIRTESLLKFKEILKKNLKMETQNQEDLIQNQREIDLSDGFRNGVELSYDLSLKLKNQSHQNLKREKIQDYHHNEMNKLPEFDNCQETKLAGVQEREENSTNSKKICSKNAQIYHQQVLNFKKDVLEDTIIRMNFNDKVLQQQKVYGNGKRLLGDTVEEAFDLINRAVTTPPSFESQQITGVPVYALFKDYLEAPQGQSFFQNPKVNAHLKNIFKVYAKLLDSPQSLQYIQGWISGEALKYWNPKQFEVNQKNPTFGFKCWHDFFLRRFKEECRPIAEGENTIANVCESFPLVNPEMPIKNVKLEDDFWLKDNRYSLRDMVSPENLNDFGLNPEIIHEFVGGTVYQAFLNPWCYHRWHSPVDGKILATYKLDGAYYLQNPGIVGHSSENYVNSQPFLSCTSVRQIYLIEADNKKIGKIFIVMVGMVEVSGCISFKSPGDPVKKGELIGEFRFGGSSHCVIFDKNCLLDFSPSLNDAYYYDQSKEIYLSKKNLVRSPLAIVKQ